MRFLTVCLLAALPCAAQQGFYPFAVDQDRLSGAPDFSFLNQPITAKDRVVVREDRFVRAADGTPGPLLRRELRFRRQFPGTGILVKPVALLTEVKQFSCLVNSTLAFCACAATYS